MKTLATNPTDLWTRSFEVPREKVGLVLGDAPRSARTVAIRKEDWESEENGGSAGALRWRPEQLHIEQFRPSKGD